MTHATAHDDMTLIATCDQLPEAQLCRSLLEENGIPCFIDGDYHDRALDGIFGQEVGIGLLVPFPMKDQAIALLNSAPNSLDLEAEAMAAPPES